MALLDDLKKKYGRLRTQKSRYKNDPSILELTENQIAVVKSQIEEEEKRIADEKAASKKK